MIMRGAAAPRALRKEVYDRMQRRKGNRRGTTQQTHTEWRKQTTECAVCGKRLQNASLKRHMKTQHGRNPEEYQCREAGQEGKTYYADVIKGQNNACPVKGCSEEGKTTSGSTDTSAQNTQSQR